MKIKLPNFLKNDLWLEVLTKRYSYILGGLLLLVFISAVLIFYFFVWRGQSAVSPAAENKITIKTELYQKIIQQIKNSEQTTKEGTDKTYRDIFR